MTDQQVAAYLQRVVAGTVRTGELMKLHTSWRIGGPADILVEPADLKDLRYVLAFARENELPVTVIGKGTNLLVTDRGIRGLVIKIGSGFSSIEVNGPLITAGAGAGLGRLVLTAERAGLGGFEFLAGIPGTVGGALYMNAGAGGVSIGDRVEEVSFISYDGELGVKSKRDLVFGYRTSEFMNMPVIIISSVLSGVPKDPLLIGEEVKKFLHRRKTTQPLDYPSAGSVFKNPPGDYAGRLIELAGGKGLREGDAQVSTVHANFFINLGNATAADMLRLIDRVRTLVYTRCGVELVLEVQVVGEL